jgi:hypothetical protein
LVFFHSSTYLSIGFLGNLWSTIPHEFSDAMCHWMHDHLLFSVKSCSYFVQTVKIVCPVIYRDKMHLLKKIFAVKPYCRCVWSLCSVLSEDTQMPE